MATIADVARRARVSPSTVSNALNGRTDRMRPQTLARVEAAIRALAFHPSTLARQLKTGQTPLIGLLVPSLANPMYGTIAREVETVARQAHGHRLLIGSTYRDREQESAFFEDLLAHGVRRVIVISSLTDERHFETAAERGMAVVSYDRRATPGRRSRMSHVTPDNAEAGRLAANHLLAHGHRRIAFATIAGMTLSRAAKIAGFRDAANAAGLGHDAAVLEEGPLDEYGETVIADVGRAIGARIASGDARPTGVVALNDLMALGLMAGLRDGGLAVPGDVSVVGIDGIALGALSYPPLSTVALPVREMARAMVDEAMRLGAGGEPGERELAFAPSGLIERGSVATMPGAARSARKPRAVR